MLVPGQQEQGCGQDLPFPAWDITTAEEPEAQAERPNSQRFKISPWKLFGCWRPGLFLAALGRSVFLLLRSRAGMNKELSSLPPRAQPWQHRLELCALSQLSRPGMSSPAWGSTHEWLRSFSSLSPLNQTFSTQRGSSPHLSKWAQSCSLDLLLHHCWRQIRDIWVAETLQLLRGLLGQKEQGFLHKPEVISLKISDSRLWCHLIAHIATAALGIFISFALLLLP